MSFRIHAAARTHPGLQRSNNEDSGYVGHRLFLVADGMGGADFGEVASALVARTMAYLDDHLTSSGITNDLPAAVEFADNRLERATAENPALHGMGTTVTAMLLQRGQVGLAHVGDEAQGQRHAVADLGDPGRAEQPAVGDAEALRHGRLEEPAQHRARLSEPGDQPPSVGARRPRVVASAVARTLREARTGPATRA